MNNPDSQTPAPSQSQALKELENARALHRKGDLDAAEPVYRKFTQSHPELADPWMLLGVVQLQRGQPADAVAQFLEAIKRDPANAFALGNLGAAYLQLQKFKEAEDALKKAIAIDPGMIEAHYNLGTLYATLSKTDLAVREFDIVLMAKPGHSKALINKGRAYMDCGRLADAEKCFRKAIKFLPDDLKAQCNLVIVLEQQNRLDEAAALSKALMKNHAENPYALFISAIIDQRQKRPEQAYKKLSALFSVPQNNTPFFRRGHYTVAQTLHDMNRFDEAFEAYEDANKIQLEAARQKGIDPATYRGEAAHAREVQKNDPALPGPGGIKGEPRQPVFFVGFPRSGTTLFEQMLAAHPDIVTAGERTPLTAMKNAMLVDAQLPCGDGVVECLNQLSDTQLIALRKIYWKNIETNVAPIGDKLLVDKMPLNITHLPLAQRLFPDAKVVMALRDPRDAVLSCYMQFFMNNDAMPNFTRLDTTAEVYDIVMGMWLELRESLNLNWIEFHYEDLVVDMKGTLDPVLDFIGVDWTDELNTYREKAAKSKINTPSYTTVGEKLFTHASGRWRNYEKHLDPVLQTLAPYIKAFGYEET